MSCTKQKPELVFLFFSHGHYRFKNDSEPGLLKRMAMVPKRKSNVTVTGLNLDAPGRKTCMFPVQNEIQTKSQN